jgi:hypothetical protein
MFPGLVFTSPVLAQVNAIVGEVIPTRVQLSFSQLQNFVADVAVERGYDYYFWGHADVALLASNASSSFADEVLGCGDLIDCPHVNLMFIEQFKPRAARAQPSWTALQYVPISLPCMALPGISSPFLDGILPEGLYNTGSKQSQ